MERRLSAQRLPERPELFSPSQIQAPRIRVSQASIFVTRADQLRNEALNVALDAGRGIERAGLLVSR
jgi:hypothetical protein